MLVKQGVAALFVANDSYFKKAKRRVKIET
jgi:hypothetical protein